MTYTRRLYFDENEFHPSCFFLWLTCPHQEEMREGGGDILEVAFAEGLFLSKHI